MAAVSLSSTAVLPSPVMLQNPSEVGPSAGRLTSSFAAGGSGRNPAQGKNFKAVRTVKTRCAVTPLQKSPSSSSTMTADLKKSWTFQLALTLAGAALSVKPFYALLRDQAKKMIRERGEKIGVPWASRLAELAKHDWETELKNIHREGDVKYPEYYLQSFHSYPEGNLSWDAALESDLASKSVHATVFTKSAKAQSVTGDTLKLRRWSRSLMISYGNETPSLEDAKITGVDLSPYFVAVANYKLREVEAERGGNTIPIKFSHAAAEDTRLPSESFDLVSCCLCFHELPTEPTRQIIKEAYRLVRPGGSFAIMDMNPASPAWQKAMSNPVLFTVFRSTEPYLEDYMAFPFEEVLEETGFKVVLHTPNTPRHRTIVAHKL
ncbi:hypothetical protein CBR_g34298 [Chara braunii]|uniref:Methyltransferase type 11 domain-containing protein n=1 Tax=Chara braunii TaxID=69332 RepID=A0A388JYT1_CHABU|nr:hypothetical protein CBR_g34298 [Chara braunii]|eukprot:GBG62927.1 hypothetical protein CBR_g34298 [Chara braunii]